MSLSRVTRVLESLHDKEVQERRKKYAKRKSIQVMFSRRNSFNDYYEQSEHFNFIGIFTTCLDVPDVRLRFVRKVISTFKSIHLQCMREVKIVFDQRFVSLESLEQKPAIHMKYALKDVCHFGLDLSSLSKSVFFFVVLDALKPITLCHVFVGEEDIDLRRIYRRFQDRFQDKF